MTDSQLNIIIQAQDNASRHLNNISSNMKGMGSMASGFTAGAVAALTTALIGMVTTGIGMALNGIQMLADAFIGASKVAGTFESAINRLGAISRASTEELKEMEEQAKSLGASTMFSATEVAHAQQFLAMAGFKVNEVLGATPSVLELAIAGNMDLARASDIASNIMGQFAIQAKDTSRVTNVLAATATSANTDIIQLSEAFKYLGPTAQAIGMSLEQTSAIIGILGDAGLQGGLAGRALGSSLVRLAQPTNQMAKAMGNMNVQAYDAQGNFVGMNKLLSQIEAGTKSMTKEQKAANLNMLLGAESFQEINVLLERGSVAFEQYEKSITGTSAAQKMAEAQNKGLEASQRSLSSAVESLQIKFMSLQMGGKSILEWQTLLINGFAELVRSINFDSAMKKLSQFTEGIEFGKVVEQLQPIADALKNSFDLVKDDYIVTFDAILDYMVNEFLPLLLPLFESLKTAFLSAQPFFVESIKVMLQVVRDTLPLITPFLVLLIGYFKHMVDEITINIIPHLVPALQAFVKFIEVTWPAIVILLKFLYENFRTYFQFIQAIITGVVSAIKGVMQVFIGIMNNDGQKVREGFLNIFNGLATIVGAVFKTIMNTAINQINAGIRSVNLIMANTGAPTFPTLPNLAKGGKRPNTPFIAGEHGPELITPSKVFTRSQTSSMNNNGASNQSYSIGQLVLQVEGVKLNTQEEISEFLDRNLKIFKRKLL